MCSIRVRTQYDVGSTVEDMWSRFLVQVRYYSISSSPKAYASSVHITAVLVRNDELPAGRVFVGVATGVLSHLHLLYIARCTPTSCASLFEGRLEVSF